MISDEVVGVKASGDDSNCQEHFGTSLDTLGGLQQHSKMSKVTAPGIRAWSPTALLTGPLRA